MKVNTENFIKVAEEELGNATSRTFLSFFLPVLSAVREAGLQTFTDVSSAIEKGKAIRKESVTKIGELLRAFEKNALANGTKIFWATDAEAANNYVIDLINKNNVPYVTKGKSMITEEIGLNDAIVANGTDVYETDLGEFIIQLLKRPPFHIIGPAINIPTEEIRDVFMEKAGMTEPTTDPVELGYAARVFLREKFHKMKIGITGVNMAIAETGSILNVENEGNIRLNKSSPDIQISIMSLEKIVATLEDALHMTRILCRNGTGQKLTGYVTIDSGPKKEDEIDGPSELHVIILDNGRSDIYENLKTREVLQCIRCGACINICPVFRQVGGYPYGWAYTGPIGKLLNPLFLGLEKTKDLYGACTLCKACESVCPAGIDHPEMMLYFRNMNAEKDPFLKGAGAGIKEQIIAKAASFAVKHSSIWDFAADVARKRINNITMNGKEGTPLDGWLKHRDFPELPGESFKKRFKTGIKPE